MKSFLTCLLLGLALNMLGGCAPPNVALISTSADPGFVFNDARDLTVQVLPMRGETIDTDFIPTLEEKVLVDDVKIGLRRAGFRVLGPGDHQTTDFVIFCRDEETIEVYDSYERIPVTDTTIGHYRTRKGYRTYYETRHSSVVVPTRRRFVYTFLELAAVQAEDALGAPATDTPFDQAAVWFATVRANGPLAMSDRPWQVAEAVWLWGETADARLEYPEEK